MSRYTQEAKPYEFAYGVQDPYQGLDFGQSEASDGNAVEGTYSVQLPDGRKQTVGGRVLENGVMSICLIT